MRKLVCNLVSAAALLLVPLAAFGGESGFGCCQRGEECINGGATLFMTCPLTGGVYTDGGVCSSTPIGTCGPPSDDKGCCQLADECINGGPTLFMTCPLIGGVFTAQGVCSSTPIGTCGPPPPATPTPEPTSTPSPAGNGASCSTPSQCISGFCVDRVCCDTGCDGAAERCDLSEREGECLPFTPAPAASGWALSIMAVVLMAIAGLALRRLKARGHVWRTR